MHTHWTGIVHILSKRLPWVNELGIKWVNTHTHMYTFSVFEFLGKFGNASRGNFDILDRFSSLILYVPDAANCTPSLWCKSRGSVEWAINSSSWAFWETENIWYQGRPVVDKKTGRSVLHNCVRGSLVVNQIRINLNWRLIISVAHQLMQPAAFDLQCPSSLHLIAGCYIKRDYLARNWYDWSFLCIYIVSLQEVLLTDKRGNLCPGRYPVYV